MLYPLSYGAVGGGAAPAAGSAPAREATGPDPRDRPRDGRAGRLRPALQEPGRRADT